MNKIACLILPLAACALALPAEAQTRKKKEPTAPAQITVINARKANLTSLGLTDDAGKPVGGLSAGLAGGKKATVKLAKGAPCTLTVAATFDDETENDANQVNVCKDKALRFVD